MDKIEGLFVVVEVSSGHYEDIIFDQTWVSDILHYDEALELKHKLSQKILTKSVRIAKLTWLD